MGTESREAIVVQSKDPGLERKNFLRDLKQLNVQSPEAAKDELKSDIETKNNRKEKFFGSSKYKLKQQEADEITALEPETVIASVDNDGFKMQWHEPDWYRDYLNSAKTLQSVKNLLDPASKAWVETLNPVVESFAKMADLSSRDFARNYKNEIWKLVKTYGKEAIYSPKGVLNLLLSVNRITNSGVDLKNPNLKAIKLVLGTATDTAGKGKERFVVVMKQNSGKKPEPAPEPQDDDADEKPPVKPPEPAVKPPEEADIYKKYGIADDLREDFDGGRVEFMAWYNDAEKMKAISDPKMMEIQPGEPERAFEARVSKLFDKENGEVKQLFDEMDAFMDGYPDYFKDSENVEVGKLKNLFMLAGTSLVRYTDKYVKASDQPEFNLRLYHAGILRHCGDINKGEPAVRKEMLPGLIESAAYLKEHDENLGEDGHDKWERLFTEYTAELAAL